MEKAAEAAKKFREDNKDDLDKMMNRDTPREDRAAIRKKIEEAGDKVVADVLKPDQVKRLKQIRVQQAGIIPFRGNLSPEVEKALKLTDKQKDDLKELAEGMQKEMREIFTSAGDDRAAAFKKMGELRKDKTEAAFKILTDEQKKAWKELTGAEFTIKFEPPPGR